MMCNNSNSSQKSHSNQKIRDGTQRTDIFQAISARLEYMTSKFSRVLFFRFDLRIPQDFPHEVHDNQILSIFLNSFTTYLNRLGIEHQYLWVREQQTSVHPHYHLIFLLNGNLTYNPHRHLNRAERLWSNLFNSTNETENRGLLHRCNRRADGSPQSNHIRLQRGSATYLDDIERCLLWAKYLSKENSKGLAPRHVHEWGASLIRK